MLALQLINPETEKRIWLRKILAHVPGLCQKWGEVEAARDIGRAAFNHARRVAR